MSESLTPDTNPEPADAPQEDAEATTTLAPDALQRELEKARREAARYRTRLREREEAERTALEEKRKAEMTAEERAKAAEARAKEALEAAERRVLTAERRAALANKVTNPDRVLRLMDDADAYFDNVTPDVDRILKDFPEYAIAPAGARASVPSANPAAAREAGVLRPEDFKGKSEAWILENQHRLKPPR